MPNFRSISFKMAVLQEGGQNLPPPHVCVIQKTPCGIGLIKAPEFPVNRVFEGKNK